jgi:hypothetical protein
MLHVISMLRLASPLVFQHRLILLCRSWLATAMRIALAFSVAGAVYGLTLIATIKSYPPNGPTAILVYGIGLGLAALLAICGGSMASPARLAQFTSMSTSSLAILLPAALYAHTAIIGQLRPGYLWYLMCGVVGSLAAMKLIQVARTQTRMSRFG